MIIITRDLIHRSHQTISLHPFLTTTVTSKLSYLTQLRHPKTQQLRRMRRRSVGLSTRHRPRADHAQPEQPKGGGGGGQPKPAGGVPMWSTYIPPNAPVVGNTSRPLPTPTPQPMPINLIPGAVPPPPPPSGVSFFHHEGEHAVLKKNYQSRPMPQV
jgi:hypothetical protein